MEAHARAQHARLQLARALSAPAAPLDAVLQGMPALAGVAPTTAALAGAPDPQAHHVLALLLQEQQRQLQGQAQLQLQLQQQHHQRQQQRQQELLLAQLHTGPGPAVQRAASLPTLLAEPLPAGSALSAHVAFPSAAASTMAVAEGPPSIEQQPSGTFEEHWRRLDTAWREAREADQEAWQQLRAKQVGAALLGGLLRSCACGCCTDHTPSEQCLLLKLPLCLRANAFRCSCPRRHACHTGWHQCMPISRQLQPARHHRLHLNSPFNTPVFAWLCSGAK